MSETLFPISFQKIVHANEYSLFVLEGDKKEFGIYTAPSSGEFVKRLFTDKPYQRPQTIDLLSSICTGLEITPFQLVLHDVKDGVYFCKLFLTQPIKEAQKILELDTRPSDGLTLALIYNFPVFCTKNLLDKVELYKE